MFKRLVFLGLIMLGMAQVSYAQNVVFEPGDGLVQLSHQHEALSGLIASLSSNISVTQDLGNRKKLIEFRDLLIQKQEKIKNEAVDFNRLLSLKLLKGLMDIEEDGEAIYLSLLQKTKEEFLNDYSTLEQKFQNDPIYQTLSRKLDEVLLLLKRAKNGKDISTALSQIEDESQRALIQRIWSEIKQKKQKQEELFKLTGQREVDWNYYFFSINSGIRVGDLLVLDDYYTHVNQVYPHAKRAFALTLLNQISNTKEKISVLNELRQNQSDIIDALLSKILRLFKLEHERREDPVIAPHQRGLSPLQAQISGGPTVNPFISQEFLGITAIGFGFGAVTVPLICVAGPIKVLLLTSLVTVLQIDDEYYFSKEGLSIDKSFGDRFLENILPCAVVLAGFRGLHALSPILARMTLLGLSSYGVYHHYKNSEYFQMTFSAMIAGMTAYQGIRYVQFLRAPQISQSFSNEANLKIIMRAPPEGRGWDGENLEGPDFFGNEPTDTSSWGRPNPFGEPPSSIRTQIPTTETMTQTRTQTLTDTSTQLAPITHNFASLKPELPTPELIPFLLGGIEINPEVLPLTKEDLGILMPPTIEIEEMPFTTHFTTDDAGHITGFFVATAPGDPIQVPDENAITIYRFDEHGNLEGIEIVKDGQNYMPIRPQDRVFSRGISNLKNSEGSLLTPSHEVFAQGEGSGEVSASGDITDENDEDHLDSSPLDIKTNDQFNADVLVLKIMAVHATSIMPRDSILKAGGVIYSDNKRVLVADEHPVFRPTIHFSLGELVRPHDISWENESYAVVLPLKFLIPQLVNINPYDTFILGDFKLPEEAILIVPINDRDQAPKNVRLFTYDPSVKTLRETVDEVIQENNAWQIRMVDGKSDFISPAYLDGNNINLLGFFRSLIIKYPHISYGNDIISQVGNGFRFGSITQALKWLMDDYLYQRKHTFEERKFLRYYIEYNIRRLERELVEMGFPEASIELFLSQKKQLFAWLNIVALDEHIRTKYNRTLVEMPQEVRKNILLLWQNPKELKHYIENPNILNQLTEVSVEGGVNPQVVAEYLRGHPVEEVNELLNDSHLSFQQVDEDILWLLYAIQRAVHMGREEAEREGLHYIIEDKFFSVHTKSNVKEIIEWIWNLLGDALDQGLGHKLDEALYILNLKNVKITLSHYYGMHLPDKDEITLDDVLRSHPKTQALFDLKQDTFGNEDERLAYTLLNQIRAIRMVNLADTYTSFNQALRDINNYLWSKRLTNEDIKQMLKSMRTARNSDQLFVGDNLSVYDKILHGDYGTLDKIWEKLGKQKEFRQEFPTDDLFWLSNQSFVEIYKMLQK